MTLSVYIARRFVLSMLAVGGIFAGLMFLIEAVEHVRRLTASGAGPGMIVWIAALRVPQGVYQILPLVTILAALSLFLTLARNSELVVARAAGRPGLRLALAPALAAALIGALAVAVLNPMVAATSERYRVLMTALTQGETSIVSVSDEALWLREGQPGQQIVIRASRADQAGTDLSDATFLFFDAEQGPVRRIQAPRAQLTAGTWVLTDAQDWDLTAPNPQAAMARVSTLLLSTSLTPEQIRESFDSPGTIAIWDLPAFIANLEQAGFSARPHRVWLQMELAMPVMLAAMVMLGAGFGMRHVRAGGTGAMVAAAIGLGFALHFMRNFAQILGEGGQIAIGLAAWSAPVAALLGAIGLILIMEER